MPAFSWWRWTAPGVSFWSILPPNRATALEVGQERPVRDHRVEAVRSRTILRSGRYLQVDSLAVDDLDWIAQIALADIGLARPGFMAFLVLSDIENDLSKCQLRLECELLLELANILSVPRGAGPREPSLTRGGERRVPTMAV